LKEAALQERDRAGARRYRLTNKHQAPDKKTPGTFEVPGVFCRKVPGVFCHKMPGVFCCKVPGVS